MTVEQFVAVLGGFAVVLGGLAKVISELREYHRAVNSKMDQLLQLTAVSSHASGVLEGIADSSRSASPPPAHPEAWSDKTHPGHN